ncbi:MULTISPECIES: LPO_1073/Vpar_1526 family protein [Methanobacterium]|jgi:hypothetical protein|uniref:Uncharacterized protein n=1 Tax=Methanobacterium subterraneum TaxID=59277 RepID=A0A2H4VN05_9EURY|nr:MULTISPECIES: LPO_1073/Vpar_1526 family protein [Methanobacterium]AUB56650.1 hypothetical protein BK007_11975 [Methanobacterium subterraneum]AUB58507.1 hypothetical protein BK008_09415 [Methanobacterium sp. MZ-A1]AUB59475.1 hypothetical protein BK009_01510 [Methanobacterium subterraneum]NMO09925.1 hypothetical protein [Methanobacterium subterraneum]
MTIDPFTSSVIGGAIGGFSQEIVRRSWSYGEKWLKNYFKDHNPQAQQKANANGLDFMVELGNRLQILEDKINDDEEMKKCMEHALSDPDFSAILYKAFISSARTSSKEKHKLLAQIVSSRLQAEEDSLKAIVYSMGVDAVPHLSLKHLRILGIMGFFMYISKKIKIPKLSEEEADKWWTKCLLDNLSQLTPIGNVGEIDVNHLSSVSCIIPPSNTIIVGHSAYLTHLGHKENLKSWHSGEFTSTYTGQEIHNMWQPIADARLTSVGLLIGISVYGDLSGNKVDVDEYLNMD